MEEKGVTNWWPACLQRQGAGISLMVPLPSFLSQVLTIPSIYQDHVPITDLLRSKS